MAKNAKREETPLMKQYYAIKRKYPDAVLLFRVGDFYETFGTDAEKAAAILGIVLTKRKNGAAATVALAGFPHHALDTYLPKLVRSGLRVAICDQLEDPKKTKTIVKRGVTELVTPGVTLNDQVLQQRQNNFLAAVHIQGIKLGISFLDISTGEFLLAEGDGAYIDKLLQAFKPAEVLVEKAQREVFEQSFGKDFTLFAMDDWAFNKDFAEEELKNKFAVKSLKGFGIEGMVDGITAAGCVLQYLKDTHHQKLGHINSISRLDGGNVVWLDRFTIRNLELVSSPNEGAKTLISVIDGTLTAMGARTLRRWLLLPLKSKIKIEARHSAVGYLVKQEETLASLRDTLAQFSDLERLNAKIATGRISPREVLHLHNSLSQIPALIKSISIKKAGSLLFEIGAQLNACEALQERIANTIHEDAPAIVSKGNVIKPGVNGELDQLRSLSTEGKDFLMKIQVRESERTGIPSLKIAFNNVFGYYIEVRNAHKDKVPAEWVRKQTLVNAERYITEELKEYEQKILGAEERIASLEAELYEALLIELQGYLDQIKLNAALIAKLDVIQGFANVAVKNTYSKPSMKEGSDIVIVEGRHPVIEQSLPETESYIPNSISLNRDQQILMITGPNMSGKSAVLRQTALICIMAQIGSYVPAKTAKLGVLDKIFSRVGASDNISSGESTFMVEMNETASILNNISNNSLILLDEIGRGTSTYDGISIAWSIAEYLHNHPEFRPKTLFATHYHELNQMTKKFDRIKNFHVSIKEVDKQILFLRTLVEGGAEHSFGIHVARLAGMPSSVLSRADQVLKNLEQNRKQQGGVPAEIEMDQNIQLSMFKLDDPVLEQIKEELVKLDVNTLTPVEALMKLNEIKTWVGGNN